MNVDFAGLSVVVTGGSGFIGTHLVEALAGRGAVVTNLDRVPPKLVKHAEYWQVCDLLDRDSVLAELRAARPRVVFNLAALTDISQGSEALMVNTGGLSNVIDAIRGVDNGCLLIHTSTQLVMRPGHEPKHPLDFAPYSDYGASKAESELILHEHGMDLDWVTVRPTNVWGPWHPTFANQIWRYIDRGLYMHPTGHDPRRSYGYVANVVHQLLGTIEAERSAVTHQTFYVGDAPIASSVWLDSFSLSLRGKPVRRVPGSLLQAAAFAGEISGRLGGPSPINRGRLYRMTTDYAVPMERTFAVLGHGPVSLDDGVRATVDWMRSNAPKTQTC